MSSAGDAAMTPSAQTGLSCTSGPGRWVLLVTVLGSAVASIDAIVWASPGRPSAVISAAMATAWAGPVMVVSH